MPFLMICPFKRNFPKEQLVSRVREENKTVAHQFEMQDMPISLAVYKILCITTNNLPENIFFKKSDLREKIQTSGFIISAGIPKLI